MSTELRISIILVLLVAVVAGCQTRRAALKPDSISAYPCHFTAGPITIDGRLDEPAWKRAEPITTFYAYKPQDAKRLSPTVARLLWGKQNLYIAIECEDRDIWSYSDKPDDDLWNGDVAELFIKPSTEKLLYYEFVMAPSGALYDARYASRGAGGLARFKDWSSGAQVACAIAGSDGDYHDDDQGYTVEMAIPLSVFPDNMRPAAGLTWTFGVFRYDYSKMFEDPLLMMSIPEAPEWGYHYYEGYAPLTFQPPTE